MTVPGLELACKPCSARGVQQRQQCRAKQALCEVSAEHRIRNVPPTVTELTERLSSGAQQHVLQCSRRHIFPLTSNCKLGVAFVKVRAPQQSIVLRRPCMSPASRSQHLQSENAKADGLTSCNEMPSAAIRRHHQVKLLILAVVACLAFQLGRKTERSQHSNVPFRELSDAQTLLHANGRPASAAHAHVRRKQITAFVGVQVTVEPHDVPHYWKGSHSERLIDGGIASYLNS